MSYLFARLLACCLAAFSWLLLSATLSLAHEKKTIIWGIVDEFPVWITSGANKGMGIMDVRLRLLMAELSDYNHRQISMSLPRVVEELKGDSRFCFMGILKTPIRETFMHFSPAALLAQPTSLVTTKSNLEKLAPYRDEAGKLDLKALLQNETFSLFVMQDRSYSPSLDTMLRDLRHEENENLRLHRGMPRFNLRAKQLLAGRLSGLLGSPLEIYNIALSSGEEHELSLLPIQNEPNETVAYVGCSKNGITHKTMSDISSAVLKLRSTADFVTPSLTWSPNVFRKDYEKLARRALADDFPD
ncbi:TIGR02285 family protein [Sneathiella limimaris]|uniref:TIGR02285 family protein n=1 Tax=Sneathiella limimaris TaxID=1964213 RepID=UPI001469EABD|nr:TIGR02285 family protein [Sneathiella limimaris]